MISYGKLWLETLNRVRTFRANIFFLFLVVTLNASSQNANWTDHMSNLPPDSLPLRAKEDNTVGREPAVVNVGKVMGMGNERDDGFALLDGNGVDTARQVILLIGDSMLDGLGNRFVDYAAENGDEFHAVIWYGSNARHWATTRDLEYSINRVRPTFIIMSLGTNDLGYYDFDRRRGWIEDIIRKFGNIPFVWIGPLPRRGIRDRRIVGIIEQVVGKNRFYDSSDTYCARIDGIHPTLPSAAKWVDNIAKWMSTPGLTAHPIKMDYPQRKVRFHADEKHTMKYHGRY